MKGTKYDQGKLRWSLFPWDALQAVGGALEYGAVKYDTDNWQRVVGARTRYFDAAMRHLIAWHRGEEIDESGHHHLAHAACCVLFLLAFSLRGKWPEEPPRTTGLSETHRNQWPKP